MNMRDYPTLHLDTK